MFVGSRVNILLIVSLSVVACSSNSLPPAATNSPNDTPSPRVSPPTLEAPTSTPLWGGGRLLIKSRGGNSPIGTYGVINLDGTGLISMWPDIGCPSYQVFSPDLSQTAVEYREGISADIYLANPDCSNKKSITDAVGNEWAPVWSPDGSRLGYVSDMTGEIQVYITDSTGHNTKQITNIPGGAVIRRWSPDGTKIVVHAPTNDKWQLYVIEIHGNNTLQLTQTPRIPDGPWSPDSKRLVLIGEDLILINADGTDPTQLTNDARQILGVSWSPDGTKLAFAAMFTDSFSEIYTIDLESRTIKRLTTNEVQDEDPRWSPDGTRIAYLTVVTDDYGEVFVMNADGSHSYHVTDLHGYYWMDRWLPDDFVP
jgi:Tol biopolymer transport system component